MANIQTELKNWSVTEASNQPDSTDPTTLAGDLRAIQSGIRYYFSQDTIASAGTTDIGSKSAGRLSITGTTTITGLGTVSAGIKKTCVFAGALTLTHNASSLILPSAANITTAANDRAEFESLGSGSWICNWYIKADGTALIIGSGTITQAKLATGVAGTGPAFMATRSVNQTITTSTFTKVQFDTEAFDTAGNYDNATNYRFTPLVAGYYAVNAFIATGAGVDGTLLIVHIYKNGSAYAKAEGRFRSTNELSFGVSTLVSMNGSTDYLEVFVFQNTGGNMSVNNSATGTYFNASMARAA